MVIVMSEEIKNNMIPDEIKSICGSCESYIIAQKRGCAFRSLGNEYCDYVLNATKLYLEKDKEIERLNNIINRIDSIYRSLCFSAPENNYIFIEELGKVLQELKGSGSNE